MAACCLDLIERGSFSPRRADLVRHVLKRLPEECRSLEQSADLKQRLAKLGTVGS